MKRSERGAARVSVIWVVAFGLLFLLGAAFGFVGYQRAADSQRAAEAARVAADQSEQSARTARADLVELSKLVGWVDPQASTPRSDLAALQSSFSDLKTALPDMGADVATLASTFPAMKSAYDAKVREIATLNEAKNKLEGEKRALEDSLREALKQNETELANLRKQLGDDANVATQQKSELESRVASLNTQRNELDSQLRESRGKIDKAQRDFDAERQTWETKRKADRAVLKFREEPEAADGAVLAMSKDLSVGWINIGAQQRLARGIRFDVRSSAPGKQPIKARAEVTEVKSDMAEVIFYDVVDRFDPVVAGDVVFNPLYDPHGARRAVTIGRFSGQFNEAELKTLLASMSITLQPKLSFDTDYLIVGSEMYVDENGQPLEEPLQPTELAVFKDAESQGVQIVSIDDLRTYFKF